MTPTEQQAFDIEIKKELNAPFPEEFIPANFHFYAARALQHQSLTSLRVDAATYEKLTLFVNGTIGQITYYEISFLINCIASATPHQLIKESDIDVDYLTIQKSINTLSFKWNELVTPIKERVQRRVKAHIIRGLNPISKNIASA